MLNAILIPPVKYFHFTRKALFNCRSVQLAQSMKTLLKKSMKSFSLMEVSFYTNPYPTYNPLFPDATTYAHHVFKAFDIESTGSINFKVIHQVLSRKHGLHFPGHAGVIVDAVARDAAREADVDIPCL